MHMGTLRVYRKPENFRLPIRYTRMPLPGSTTNYTFCRGLTSEVDGFDLYQIGVYFLIRYEILYPEENRLVEREFTCPELYTYSIYVPHNDNLIYCVGSDIDVLHEPLSLFLGGRDPLTTTFNLQRLEDAHTNGRINILGQVCIKRGGTLRLSQRKLNGLPFAQNDPDFERGNDINNKCFEILITIDNVPKSFYVYPDGVITTKGKVPPGSEGFRLLRYPYDFLRRI